MLKTEVLPYQEQILFLFLQVKIFTEFLLFESNTLQFYICELATLIQGLKIVERLFTYFTYLCLSPCSK